MQQGYRVTFSVFGKFPSKKPASLWRDLCHDPSVGAQETSWGFSGVDFCFEKNGKRSPRAESMGNGTGDVHDV